MKGIDVLQKILHLCTQVPPEEIMLASYLADVYAACGVLTFVELADKAGADRYAYVRAAQRAHALKLTKHEGRPRKIYPILTERGRRYLIAFFPEE